MELLKEEDKRRFGNDYVKLLIKALKSAGKDSSGKLIRSLNYRLSDTATAMDFIFDGEDYFSAVDEGRKSGTYPPIKAIKDWARIKGIDSGAVFPIARSIYKFGIKPSNIFEKANNAMLNGRVFDDMEDSMVDNIETIVITELEKINKA